MKLALYQLGVNGAVTLGIVPPSKPNGAGYSALSGLQPSITTQYPGSATDTFDFHSLYAGCVAKTQETVASVVTRCSILVQGYRATRLVAKQRISYDFGVVALRAPMQKFSLDNFTNIDTVTFASEFTVGDLLGVTIFDDLDYTVYYPTPESRKVNGTESL